MAYDKKTKGDKNDKKSAKGKSKGKSASKSKSGDNPFASALAKTKK